MPNTKNTDIDRLQRAITDMDAMSQDGFSKISAIARLVIKTMENKDNQNPISMDDIVTALHIIWDKSEDIQNCINCEAEEVGCHYTTRKMEVNHV